MEARIDDYSRDEAYRIYVTKSLQLAPQNKYLQTPYLELLEPKKINIRSGDDIAADIFKRAGLKFKE